MNMDILKTFDETAYWKGDEEYRRAHYDEAMAYYKAKEAADLEKRINSLRIIAKSYEDAAVSADAFVDFIKPWNGKVINKRFYDALDKADIGVEYRHSPYSSSEAFQTKGTNTAAGIDNPRILYMLDRYRYDKDLWTGDKKNRMNAAAWIEKIQKQKEQNQEKADSLYDEADHIMERIDAYNKAAGAMCEAASKISGYARDIFRQKFIQVSTIK